jgi:signal transduction histidine kinase
MHESDLRRAQAAEEYALQVLEERNKVFRVLYDTVLTVESTAEENIFALLCHNLCRITNAAWAALASYDQRSGVLLFEALDIEAEAKAAFDSHTRHSARISAETVSELIEVQIKECREHGHCLVEFFPDAFRDLAKTTAEARCYRVSCVRENQLLAIGAIQLQPGQRLRMCDMVEIYLNTAGMIIERVYAVQALRRHEEQLEELVARRTAELVAANHALQQSLEQLKRTQKQLVQSEKMAALGSLVAGIAHEINTPVGIGVTAASHLELKTHEVERLYTHGLMTRTNLEEYFRTAIESTRIIMTNLKRAANHIRSFKQVAVDQTHEEKRPFKLKAYLDEVLLSLHPELKKTPHRVLLDCPPDLTIDSYPGAFSQILTNLVMNSLIHAFPPGVEGCIELQLYQANQTLWMRYSDNGIGIKAEECARIFEPFYTTRRGQGGHGLGLHIVYNLVTRRLQGQITCESSPAGTTFLIHVPIGDSETDS